MMAKTNHDNIVEHTLDIHAKCISELCRICTGRVLTYVDKMKRNDILYLWQYFLNIFCNK